MNRLQMFFVAVACAAGMAVAGQAREVTGKWKGETESGRPILLDVKQSEKKLTGTLTLAEQTADITGGTVEGQDLSFTVTVDDRTISVKGRLVGADLELTAQDTPGPVVLKRVS